MQLFEESSLNEVKNKAFLTYAEWGPKLLTSREQRLSEEFPEVAADVRATWIEEFKSVNSEIWKVAEEGGPKSYTYETFAKRMGTSFPFMNQGALERAWFLVGYFAWREGYR